ncbi:MAG: DUF5596 domain-containing protein [Clostridia bacterium]|nr:DUF5596 domain-containing protein [Clostridia bacterium]
MIKGNALDFMQKLDFPIDAQKKLLDTLDIILQTSQYANTFCGALDYYDSVDFDFSKMLEDIKSLAESANICEYTAYMLLFICLAPKLHTRYKQKGISDAVFYDTMADLKYKLEECRLVHGKVGTFVASWYKGFFEMKIFALGRLQFEIKHTWFECTVDGVHIPKDKKVLSVHIPRTNTRLEHSLVIDSYKQAAEFFKEEFGDIIFICNSWLLYPWNRTVLKDGSNLAQFYDDFTIVSSGEYQNYSEVWRLFDCLYDDNPDNLPNDSSLRRAYIERIKSGQPIGHGTGVILFDK